MARYWKSFETKEEQKEWEKQEELETMVDGYEFKVCMRMRGKDLIHDLPYLNNHINENAYVTIYAYKKEV